MKNLLFLLALSFLTFSCGSPTIDENGRDENGDFPKSETVYEQPTNPGYTETEYTTDPGSTNRRPILKADPAKQKAKEPKTETTQTPVTTPEIKVVEQVDYSPLILSCDAQNRLRLRKRKCTDVFLSKFVYDNLKAPEKLDTSGTVLVRFVVKEDGTIHNPTVIQSLSSELDASALAVVNKLKNDNVKWKPALVNGEPVPSYFVLPIEFKI